MPTYTYSVPDGEDTEKGDQNLFEEWWMEMSKSKEDNIYTTTGSKKDMK